MHISVSQQYCDVQLVQNKATIVVRLRSLSHYKKLKLKTWDQDAIEAFLIKQLSKVEEKAQEKCRDTIITFMKILKEEPYATVQ